MTPARPLLHTTLWRHRHFYLFVSPFFISFAIFGFYPLLFSLYLSVTSWDGLGALRYVGLQNFRTLFQDRQFYDALWTTLLIGVLHMVPMLTLAFAFALLLNRPVRRLRGLFRAVVFMPSITPMVVVATVFSLLYGAEFGLLNSVLRSIGLPAVPWLSSAGWAPVSVSLLLIWRWTGYTMVLMLAGLQGISPELYESATLDGAGAFHRLMHITLPLMKPTLTFCIVMSIVGTIYMFDEVFVLTNGGPGVATTNVGLYLFNQAFGDFKFGYASAAGYTVAAAVFVGSIIAYRLGRRRTA